jgi:hypothetical protein
MACALLKVCGKMPDKNILEVRHVKAGGRKIPVHFSRNVGGSVAGCFVLGAQDTPVVDGPDPETVLALLRDLMDSALLARTAREAAAQPRPVLARRRAGRVAKAARR